jgi:bifunctional NMN adenylyltransferase/nudix hydrolase
MSQKPYDLIVFIGRFQPVHTGHINVIQTALSMAEDVVVLVGSSNQPRTSKNPWLFHEREAMIYGGLDEADRCRTEVKPLHDQKYNDQAWASEVQRLVDEAAAQISSTRSLKIALIGHNKDESSYYLKMFPQWKLIDHEMNENINATDLREIMFEGKSLKFLSGVLPQSVLVELERFTYTEDFKLLQREYNMIKSYKKAWEAAPYAPIFVTVDAVVVQSGHILLVERDAAPGEGLFAMPGGFLNQDEWIEDGVLRELREETKLRVPTPVLKGSIKYRGVFDRPDRSLRGRTITHAYLIELPPGELPTVKGSDDARSAFWLPISELSESQMFEDHYHVIKALLGKL